MSHIDLIPGGNGAEPAARATPRPPATRPLRADETREEAFWDGAVFGFYGARYWGDATESAELDVWAVEDLCEDIDGMWDDDLDV